MKNTEQFWMAKQATHLAEELGNLEHIPTWDAMNIDWAAKNITPGKPEFPPIQYGNTHWKKWKMPTTDAIPAGHTSGNDDDYFAEMMIAGGLVGGAGGAAGYGTHKHRQQAQHPMLDKLKGMLHPSHGLFKR